MFKGFAVMTKTTIILLSFMGINSVNTRTFRIPHKVAGNVAAICLEDSDEMIFLQSKV